MLGLSGGSLCPQLLASALARTRLQRAQLLSQHSGRISVSPHGHGEVATGSLRGSASLWGDHSHTASGTIPRHAIDYNSQILTTNKSKRSHRVKVSQLANLANSKTSSAAVGPAIKDPLYRVRATKGGKNN